MTVTQKLHLMEEMEARNNARLRAVGLLHRTGRLIRNLFTAAAEDATAYWGNFASDLSGDGSMAALEAEARMTKTEVRM